MGISWHIRLAIIGVSFLAMIRPVSPTSNFDFPDCVEEKCIPKGGCPPTNGRCLCKAARGIFLETVLKCMYSNCKADLSVFEDSFLDPMTEGCDALNQDIPRSELKIARAKASSLLAKLSSTPTATTTATTNSPVQILSKSTTSAASTNPSTSSSMAIQSTTTTDGTIAVTESTFPPSSVEHDNTTARPTSAPSSTAESQSVSSAPPSSNFVDTSPFTNTNSAKSPQDRLLDTLLAIPLAVALLLR
ncbi:hypothetical protein QBC35DRAFT_115975 [Podospora australis]|uniref:Extracellular membrane protein CFEM domain-containing protein n=1 Tax=Podospora australis TaxID=1536484 RepID=A0AAN7AE80_9PEZI|nr:hypothetical protein QBC35DRAFT_115975 [Podospora australis]